MKHEMRRRAVLSVGSQTNTSYLAYLAYRSIFFPHERAGRGAYLSFSHKVNSFFLGDAATSLAFSYLAAGGPFVRDGTGTLETQLSTV